MSLFHWYIEVIQKNEWKNKPYKYKYGLYIMGLPIITKINGRKHFQELLDTNPGVLIIKFGATWCGPCKVIEKDVEDYFQKMPDNIQCAMIDVDENIDLYGFLKTKKMVKGIPAILGYYQENTHYAPDEFISGTNKNDLDYFFTTCLEKANE